MVGSGIEGPGDFSLAPNASRATCELLRSASRSCSAGRSAGVDDGLVICDGCEREMCKPALAMELRLDSGFDGGRRNEMGSGLVTATGSLFECSKVAMEAEGFAPASSGGRTKATATSENMLESVRKGIRMRNWG